MTRPVVGVLGAGGTVGSAVMAMLPAQVSRPGFRADLDNLDEWIAGLTVVINCTGVPMAARIHAAGADYVDPGARHDDRRDLPTSSERVAVYDAGAMPGAIGLLPRLMAAQLAQEHGERPVRLSVVAGGLYRFTPASAREFRATRDGWRAQADRVNRALGLATSDWVTRFEGECVRRLMRSETSSVDELITASRADVAGRAEHLSVSVELTGEYGTVRRMCTRTGPELTARTAVSCARHLLAGEVASGAHSADDILDPALAVPSLFGQEEGSL